MVRTPIIYPGGKTLLLPYIRPLTPPHSLALDLFGGGGAWILDGTHERGVYNDINSNAVNFFRVLRDAEKSKLLAESLRCTPFSREEYFSCDASWQDSSLDEVERARRWFVVINMGFTHEEDCHSFRVSARMSIASSVRNHVDRLGEVHERLRDVVIEHLDFRDALKIYGRGKDTLIFADPPYITQKKDSLKYARSFTMQDHIDLLHALSETDAQVILCGYESEVYFDLLRPPLWSLVQKVRIAQVGNSDYNTRETRTEHIWVKKYERGLWS